VAAELYSMRAQVCIAFFDGYFFFFSRALLYTRAGVYCSVFKCGAVCCSVVSKCVVVLCMCVEVCCSVLQCVALL